MEEISGIEKCKTIKETMFAKVHNHEFIIYPNVFNPSCFDGADFYAKVLIDVIAEFLPAPLHILELGTGAGYYAILAALHGAAHVTCTDINHHAIKNTQENVKRYHFEEKITVLHSDIFDSIKPEDRFDMICWNIPFESTNKSLEELTLLERSVYDPNSILLDRYVQMADRSLIANTGRLFVAYSTTFGSMTDFERIATRYRYNIKCISEINLDKHIHLGYYELIKISC